jgi:hypothetical protein
VLASVAESRCSPQCQGMMTFIELASLPSDPLAPFADQLRLAVAAYLARFKGSSRPRGLPPLESGRELPVQAGHAQGLGQQDGSGLGDDPRSVGGHLQLRACSGKIHLESASRTGVEWTLDKPYSPSSRHFSHIKRPARGNPSRKPQANGSVRVTANGSVRGLRYLQNWPEVTWPTAIMMFGLDWEARRPLAITGRRAE